MSFEYLVAFGSNIEPRITTIEDALNRLAAVASLSKISSFYTSAPIGKASLEFINGALVCSSQFDPERFLLELQTIEAQLGRVRVEKWGNRTLDLDILLARQAKENLNFRTCNLSLPHPQLRLRDFVLVPAEEIAGDWLVDTQTIADYQHACEMNSILTTIPYTHGLVSR